MEVTNLDVENILGNGMFTGTYEDKVLNVLETSLEGDQKYVIVEGCNIEQSQD